MFCCSMFQNSWPHRLYFRLHVKPPMYDFYNIKPGLVARNTWIKKDGCCSHPSVWEEGNPCILAMLIWGSPPFPFILPPCSLLYLSSCSCPLSRHVSAFAACLTGSTSNDGLIFILKPCKAAVRSREEGVGKIALKLVGGVWYNIRAL